MTRSVPVCLLIGLVGCVLASPADAAAASGKPAAATVALLGKDFQFLGDWVKQNEFNRTVLFSTSQEPKYPPVAAIVVPRSGKYRVWVAAKDFPKDRPGIRTFSVRIAGKKLEPLFGKSGKDNYEFEDGGWIDLTAGPTLVTLENARTFARFHGLILTDDPNLTPTRPITPTAYPPARLHSIGPVAEEQAKAALLRIDTAEPQAVLANDQVRYEFLPARRGELPTLAMSVKLKTPEGWQAVQIDPAAEGYFANVAPADTQLVFTGFYPLWTRTDVTPITVEAGGVRAVTAFGRTTNSQTQVGTRTQLFPKSAVAVGDEVRIAFHPSPAGQLSAVWRLAAGQRFADVELSFAPKAEGQAALSYELFFRRELAAVAELLLPMMYHRKRLPEQDVTLLSNTTPTPLSLVQPAGPKSIAMALIADPRDIPFEWPDGRRAPYALSIRGPKATVQPSIGGPVLGTPAAAVKERPVRLRFKVLVQPGDWYAGFRTSVDEVFGVRDYRQSVRTSLSDAVLNMIDLYLDDNHGGWWERAKAPYQIESQNGSTHAAPLLPLSLYRLSGDPQILDRRALPTLAFMLSREGAHFSPVPEPPGLYPSGSMNGPVKLFGTTTYAGLWALSGRRTPALREIANPPGDPRPTAGYSHAAKFDEHLARHLLTGDPADLAKACELADAYIKTVVAAPPSKDLGPQPFFFISFVPNWEGLLHLYERTGKQAYLDAAVFGARQLMTGLWSQPAIPPGSIAVHPTRQFEDRGGHAWWKGPERYRLGTPRRPNDTPAHEVPAWTVSNVGLGFEQPITYRSSGAGRLIWQMGFSADFLRLYRYTRDPAFLTCARNAVVGRWGSYPGYYVTGFTDLPQNPDYPRTGPDVTDFYYHHIAPHLTWSIDYLVSEAELLSDGAIAFPSLRQYGYAYFDSRVYGHAPGKVYGESAWLLFRRGVVSSDNPQINTLMAWSEGKLHVVLTNQSQQPQKVVLAAGAELRTEAAGIQATIRSGSAQPTPLATDRDGRSVSLTVAPRGLATVTLAGVRVEPPARPQQAEKRQTSAASLVLPGEIAQTRAAALQVEPGAWHAYVWSTATSQKAQSAALHYRLAGQWQTLKKNEYPFEFMVPVSDERQPIEFKLELTLPDGKTVASPPATLRLTP